MVFGLHRSRGNAGRLGKSGLVVVAALVWLGVGTAIEFRGFPLGSDALTFEADVRPVLANGWWIQLLGTLFLTLAVVPLGIDLVRQRVLSAWTVPVLVFGAVTTVFLTPAFSFPGVVWIVLGLTLLRHRGRAV